MQPRPQLADGALKLGLTQASKGTLATEVPLEDEEDADSEEAAETVGAE